MHGVKVRKLEGIMKSKLLGSAQQIITSLFKLLLSKIIFSYHFGKDFSVE